MDLNIRKRTWMKNLINLILAGIIGGIIAIGITSYGESDNDFSKDRSPAATPVSLLNSSPLPTASIDFVKASEGATESVVHIYAEEDVQLAAQRRKQERNNRSSRDRFGGTIDLEDFFGGDMFGRNFYGPKNGTGSGVIISDDGYIVTNNHVVGFADFIQVTLSDGRKVEAEKIGTDPSTDLAVLKIQEDNLRPLLYADSDHVRVGEWVLAVGNPFDLTSTVTAGIVSAKGRDLNIIKGDKSIEEFIQTDAAVNPGNSGGALVDTDGNLVGINTAIATPTGVYAGYSFAIPSNLVKRIVYDIIEGGGSIERTNLGIVVLDIDEEVKRHLNLDVDKGVYVDEVLKGSTAQFAGLLPGDIIRVINKRSIDDFDDIKDAMKFSKVGDTLDMEILRNGRKKDVSVKMRKGI